MNWELAIMWFVTFVISVTFHEAAHAWFAMLGGDRTAYYAGQVTINPIPHMRREPFGMVVLPILMLLVSGGKWCFGFAHAPIDPIWAYHHPKKAALMSAAGPLANLVLAAVAFTILWFVARPDGDTMVAIRKIAGVFLFLNIVLLVFNLIPLPPLDGAGVVQGLYPPARKLYDGLMSIPYMSLVILVMLFYYAGDLIFPVLREVNGWLPYSLYRSPTVFG